jgi:SAM-dependent methyltransferase
MPEMPALARTLCTSPPYRLFARRVLLPWALQGVVPSGEVLEIGSGSGAMAGELLKRFPELRVVATDYDPAMVAVAQRTLARFGERVIVQRVDASVLPFEDGRFDLVLSFAMLHHVGAWEGAVAEAIRVLRPGGKFLGYDLIHSAPHRHGNQDRPHEGHDGGRGATRMITAQELRTELGYLPVKDVRTPRARILPALRFTATRA